MTPSVAMVAPAESETDGRAGLRAAIAAKQEAERAFHAHRLAIGRAEDLVSAARQKVESSEQAVEAAKSDYAGAIRAHVGGGAAASPGGVKAARAAVADAVDEAEAAEAALATLQEGMADFQDDVSIASLEVVRQRNALIEPIVRAMAAEVQKMRVAIGTAKHLMRVLSAASDPMPVGSDDYQVSAKASEISKATIALQEVVNHALGSEITIDAARIRQFEHFKHALLIAPETAPPPD